LQQLRDLQPFRFDGDLDDYAKWAADNPGDAAEKPAKPARARPAGKGQGNRGPALKTRMARLDRQLAEVHRQQEEVELQLSAADIYAAANQSRLGELLAQQGKLKKELGAVEAEWLQVAELLQVKDGESGGR
jgi:hypothetical protein